jgi:hypothetical protein
MLVGADAKKASKRHDGIGNLPADFIDHEPLNAPKLVALRAKDRRTFDPITID